MAKMNSLRNKKTEAWPRPEIREQTARHKKIEKEINVDLAPERGVWIERLLERIQTRGFNVHAGIRRKIKPEEIPTKPKRKFKVVV